MERAGKVRAVGREDRAAAVAEQVRPREVERKTVGIRRCPLEVAWRNDVRAALARDVHERRLPDVTVVCGRCDVDLDTGLVDGEPRERHVVLPADEAADAAEAGLDGMEPTAVPLAPDQ